jgi:RHS repeat-associated protein
MSLLHHLCRKNILGALRYGWDVAFILLLMVVVTNSYNHVQAAAIGSSLPEGIYYPLLDQQGSVRALTDSGGTVKLRQSYDPWGAIRSQTGTAGMTTLGWAGERVGTADGLVWLRARHYAPALGRFVQRDTVAGDPTNGQALNRYAGLQNNPVNLSDPSGNMPCRPGQLCPGNLKALEYSSTGQRARVYVGGYLEAPSDDSLYNRYPRGFIPSTVRPGARDEINQMNQMSNNELFDIVDSDVLGGVATRGGVMGTQIMQRWRQNRDALHVYPLGSPMSLAAQSSSPYRARFRSIAHEIRRQLQAQYDGGKDPSMTAIWLSSDFLLRNYITWRVKDLKTWIGSDHALPAVIGGTKGMSVYLSEFHYNSTTNRYSMRVTISVYDIFGLNDDDTYQTALNAFWVLQHQRGIKPFYNRIDTSVVIKGKVYDPLPAWTRTRR